MRPRGRIDPPRHNGERARLSGTSTVCSRGFCRPLLAYLSETVAERTTDHVARRTGARDEPIGQAGIGEDLRCLMAWRTAFDNTNWKLGAILNVIKPHDPSPIRTFSCRLYSNQR